MAPAKTNTSLSDALELKFIQFVRPLPTTARLSILESVWNLVLSSDEYNRKLERLDPYFRHYEEQCEQLPHGRISMLTHRELLRVVELLKGQKRITCTKELLIAYSNDLPFVNDVIEFAASALLLLKVSKWKDSQYLRDFIHSQFNQKPSYDQILRLPKSFSLEAMDGVAGIKVQWTGNIMDHLSLRNDDTDVVLFHHIGFLDLCVTSDVEFFPEGLIEETKRTLSLLLPHSKSTKKWLREQRRKVHLDPQVEHSGPYLRAEDRSTGKFWYWRDRLIILKETFDEHEPRGLRQYWNDDRKSIQWWTFWVALIVFVFGVIQCIEGALQVYKAWHPS